MSWNVHKRGTWHLLSSIVHTDSATDSPEYSPASGGHYASLRSSVLSWGKPFCTWTPCLRGEGYQFLDS